MPCSDTQARRHRDDGQPPRPQGCRCARGDRSSRCNAAFLPKYSPDLNPIEQAFSKLKAHLRKAAERTIPRLSRRIGKLMDAFTPQECANYFRHAGYASI